jgi:DNA-binding CsgD family transcriptional regulator
MKIARLLGRGKSINDIASIMKVDPKTIYSDQKYIRINVGGVMQKYIVETLPNELSKCLLRQSSQ